MMPISRWVLLIAGITIFSNSATAFGQWNFGPQYACVSGGFYGNAQNLMAANAIGLANPMISKGVYNEQTSRAMINYERARNLYIDNQQKAFHVRKEIKQEIHAENLAHKEAAHEARLRADEFLATHGPLPLSNSQLDRATGHIEWPVALVATDFDLQRKSLDSLFASRVNYGTTALLSSQIRGKVSEMKQALHKHITKMPLAEYSEARQFLDSMIASTK